MKTFAIALCALLAGTAWASAARDAAAAYEVASLKNQACRAEYKLAALNLQSGSGSAAENYRAFLQCRTEATKAAKDAYGKTLARLKTADSKRALKDYHAALMTSIDGGEQRDGESVGQHLQRVRALDSSAEAAWQRLQLEL